MTREEITAKAVEMGLTLTEEKIAELIKNGKAPTIQDDSLYSQLGGNETAWNIIKDLRHENAEKRITIKEVTDKLKAIEDAKLETEKKALEDSGKWEDLYKKADEKIKTLEPVVNQYNEFDKQKREQYKKDLGDKWVDSFATIPLAELDALHEKLTDKKLGVYSSNHQDRRDEPDKPLTIEDKIKTIYTKKE